MKKIGLFAVLIAVGLIVPGVMTVADEKTGVENIDYRGEMRKFVELISARSKSRVAGFYVIGQNALPLVTINGKHDGRLATGYVKAIDGVGIEELFYGHERAGVRSSEKITRYMLPYLERFRKTGKTVMVVDYVASLTQAEDSHRLSSEKGFISFQGQPQLSTIPPWKFDISMGSVTSLDDAENFLYLLNPSGFRNRESYLNALRETNHDILLVDAFFWGSPLTSSEVSALKKKRSGERRLVLSYMSIGEAEDYRYYWKDSWKKTPPPFLERENLRWRGNYKVRYWMDQWQRVICGSEDGSGFESSYLGRVMNAGFDGVYLDILDAAFYFEQKNPR